MNSLKMFTEHNIKKCIGELRHFFGGVMGIETILEHIVCEWDIKKYITFYDFFFLKKQRILYFE